MKFERRIVYPVMAGMVSVGSIIRVLIFSESGAYFHVGSALLSCFFMPLLWELMGVFIRFLDRRIPFEHGIKRRIVIQIVLSIVLFVSHTMLVFWLIGKYFREYIPIHAFTAPFITIAYVTNTIIIIAINLLYIGRYFFERWKEELLHSERLQKERVLVQFDNLKNQFNPHFLFNALTSLHSLIFENQRLASEFVQQLAKVYRYVLQHKEKNLVTLDTELQFIRHYVHLLQTRFGNAFCVEFHIAEPALELYVVPVTLQILIENAIKHNRISATSPLHLNISTETLDNTLMLTVQNTLQRKAVVESSNQMGLHNLQALYRYLSPVPVVIRETELHFSVLLPLLLPEHRENL